MVGGGRERRIGGVRSGVLKEFGHDFYQRGTKRPDTLHKYYDNNIAQLRSDHPR
jgi:hypothetical protein